MIRNYHGSAFIVLEYYSWFTAVSFLIAASNQPAPLLPCSLYFVSHWLPPNIPPPKPVSRKSFPPSLVPAQPPLKYIPPGRILGIYQRSSHLIEKYPPRAQPPAQIYPPRDDQFRGAGRPLFPKKSFVPPCTITTVSSSSNNSRATHDALKDIPLL